MPFEVFALSEQGSAREVNADQFLVANLTKTMTVVLSSLDDEALSPVLDLEGYLFAVADGVSSLPDSDRGSALATEILAGYLLHTVPWFLSLRPDIPSDLKDELREALRTCDRVLQSQAGRSEGVPMASTLTVAYAAWSRLYVAHAGDSRCYLLRGTELVRVTRDQTMAQVLVDKGTLSEAQARDSQWSRVLTSVIGGEEADLQVQVKRLELTVSDLVLLSSDGLHGAISDDQIRGILLQGTSVEETTCSLVRAAQDANGRDDVTAVLARFQE